MLTKDKSSNRFKRVMQAEIDGDIAIVGGVYDLATGVVRLL